MKKFLICLLEILLCTYLWAQSVSITGKRIYIPKDFQFVNLDDSTSQWSYHRMALTKDFAVFWQKGFGNDLKNPPLLNGNDMHVDLGNIEQKLERFYTFYRDTLKFIKPGSNADNYRMMVMINYSLDGTAYGGDYDRVIGAFWVAPNRIHDVKLNCVAHELGHSFQSQIACDKKLSGIPDSADSMSWGGGFCEMTSQWMLWQVNPDWVRDENYHWEAFKKLTYKAFLHVDNIYHSPYILEYWSMKHGLPFIAEMYRQGKSNEDVVMTYKRMTGLSQRQFNDEMFDANSHIVNFDYPRVWKETRPYACSLSTHLIALRNGWYEVANDNCPENYGFNAIPLSVPESGNKVKVYFKGLVGRDSINIYRKAGWRYGFIGVTLQGKTIYGKMSRSPKGVLTFNSPNNVTFSHLYLVVMGAPKVHSPNPFFNKGNDEQWPYKIKFIGTQPLSN